MAERDGSGERAGRSAFEVDWVHIESGQRVHLAAIHGEPTVDGFRRDAVEFAVIGERTLHRMEWTAFRSRYVPEDPQP